MGMNVRGTTMLGCLLTGGGEYPVGWRVGHRNAVVTVEPMITTDDMVAYRVRRSRNETLLRISLYASPATDRRRPTPINTERRRRRQRMLRRRDEDELKLVEIVCRFRPVRTLKLATRRMPGRLFLALTDGIVK